MGFVFKPKPLDIIECYLNRADLFDVLAICRKEATSNVDLIKMVIKDRRIGQYQYIDLVIKSWEDNDNEVFDYLWHTRKHSGQFKYWFALACITRELEELFIFSIKNLNIAEFLRRYGTTLTLKFYDILIDECPDEFFEYFKPLCWQKPRAAYKIYKKSNNTTINLTYLKYLCINQLIDFEHQKMRLLKGLKI